jgi:hypothetical protein
MAEEFQMPSLRNTPHYREFLRGVWEEFKCFGWNTDSEFLARQKFVDTFIDAIRTYPIELFKSVVFEIGTEFPCWGYGHGIASEGNSSGCPLCDSRILAWKNAIQNPVYNWLPEVVRTNCQNTREAYRSRIPEMGGTNWSAWYPTLEIPFIDVTLAESLRELAEGVEFSGLDDEDLYGVFRISDVRNLTWTDTGRGR